jgi:hypothetical protein
MPRSFNLSRSFRFPIHNLPIAPHSAVLRLYNVAQWNFSYCQGFGTDVNTAYFFLIYICQWRLWTARVHAARSGWCKSTWLGKFWIYLHSLWRVDRGYDYFSISLNRKKRYSSSLSLTSELDRVGGQRHTTAALPPGKIRYPLYGRLGGP